jgi:hypothetical protein
MSIAKNTKTIILGILLFLASNYPKLYSQPERVWFHPGFKIGYQFGSANGLLVGIELSVVW